MKSVWQYSKKINYLLLFSKCITINSLLIKKIFKSASEIEPRTYSRPITCRDEHFTIQTIFNFIHLIIGIREDVFTVPTDDIK